MTAPFTVLHADAAAPRHKRLAGHHLAAHHESVRRERGHHEYVHQARGYRPYVLIRPEYERHGLRRVASLDLRAYDGFSTDLGEHAVFRHGVHSRMRLAHHRLARGGMSCVPYARRASGINLVGNAWEWWNLAVGVYARGRVPQLGSVLAFRSNPHMRLGHVAVVARVINSREIEIDQANWYGRSGSVSVDVPVVDVSEANDWTAVRVRLADGVGFGAVYPTYGFIYDQPDTGVISAAVTAPAPQPQLNPVPRDLRPAVERPWQTYEEVAEASDSLTGRRSVVQAVNRRR